MRTRRRRDDDEAPVIEINESPNVDILQRLPRERRRTVRYIDSLDAFNHQRQRRHPTTPENSDAQAYLQQRATRSLHRTSLPSSSEESEEEEDGFQEQPSFGDDENDEVDETNESDLPSPQSRRSSGVSIKEENPSELESAGQGNYRYSTRRRSRSSIEPEDETSSRQSIEYEEPRQDEDAIEEESRSTRYPRRRSRGSHEPSGANEDEGVSYSQDNNTRYTLRNRSKLAPIDRLYDVDTSDKKKSIAPSSLDYGTRSAAQASERHTRYLLRSKRDAPPSPKNGDGSSKGYSLRNRNAVRRQQSSYSEAPRLSNQLIYDDYGDPRPPKRSKSNSSSAPKYMDLSGSSSSSEGEMQTMKRSKKKYAKSPKAPPPADISPLDIDPSITWDSIGGLKSHIHSLQEMVILPLLYPEFYSKFSLKPPSGVLFYGPPGTGKTLVARALANSTGSQKITFYMRKGADCLSKWVGEAERQLRVLFEQAKKTEPSIIFFDEIDGLAPVRSAKQDQIHASIVSTLLALMDGLDSRGRVIVIGATNRIDAIDPALRRPGRFDRELAFTLPNATDRAAMLAINTKEWQPPLSLAFRTQLANELVGYCGADIKALCAETALVAFKRTFPQVYDTPAKLEIDVNAIQVLRADFQVAQAKIVPAAARAQSAVATPLPPLLKPLLEAPLTGLVKLIQTTFPGGLFAPPPIVPSSSTPIYELPSSSCAGCLMPLMDDSSPCSQCQVLFHPACLRGTGRCSSCVPSYSAMGQAALTSALLSHMDGFPCIQFDRFSTPAQWMAKWAEVLSHVPCVVYCPHLDQAWVDHPNEIPPLLHHWVQTAQHLPIVLIATASTRDLPSDFADLFPTTHQFQLKPPSRAARHGFWQVVQTWASSPPPIPLPPPKPLRVVAPPPTKAPKPSQVLTDHEQHQLRELRIFLEAVVSYCIRQKSNASFVAIPDGTIDLSTMRDKVHDGEYTTWEKFMTDVHAMVQDAYAAYPKYSPLRYIAHAAANMQDNVMSFAHRFRKEQGYDLFAQCREIQQAKLAKRPVPAPMPLKRPGQLPPPTIIEVENGNDSNAAAEVEEEEDLETFQTGDHVFVAKRTGPGMNKLGGAGLVQQVYVDDETERVTKYDVKYVLGGFEKEVEARYVRRLTEDTVQESVKMHAQPVLGSTLIAAAAAAPPTADEVFDATIWPHLYQAGWEFVAPHMLWVENPPESTTDLTKDELQSKHTCFESRDDVLAFVKQTPKYARLCFGQRYVEMNIADGLLPKPTPWTPQEEIYYMMLEDKPIEASQPVVTPTSEPDFILDEAALKVVVSTLVDATDGWSVDDLRQALVKVNHIVLAHRQDYDRSAMIAFVCLMENLYLKYISNIIWYLAPVAMEIGDVAAIQTSRVGREKQRYDGHVRLIVCVVPLSESNQVLLISSSQRKDGWILPKGGWEDDETAEESVLRELQEEAGVEGIVMESLGEVNYASKNKSDCDKPSRLIGFTAQVTKEFKEWPESQRKRTWVDFEMARKLLEPRPELLAMLNRAVDRTGLNST
ncbi:unnamed protein product [Aphanomyces euteiches]